MVVGTKSVPLLWVGGLVTQHPAAYSPRHRATFNGYQTMLNFRAHQGNANAFAPSVSLAELLQGKVTPDQIRNRVVLIGYSDRTDRTTDFYNSPYGELSGVVLQGQMASQVISAALNGRPLIWWWSTGGETLWILAWSVAGGWLVWRLVRPSFWAMGGGILLLGLVGICYGVMVVNGGWLPLLPAALGMAGTGTVVGYLSYRIRHP
jgi:CHASE2 domain-containing sensor protein